MSKTTTEKFEQIAIDFEETMDVEIKENVKPKPKKSPKVYGEGTKVRIKEGVTKFIDGRSIPDIAREDIVYIKRINNNGTVLLEFQPNGKILGSLLRSDIY